MERNPQVHNVTVRLYINRRSVEKIKQIYSITAHFWIDRIQLSQENHILLWQIQLR